MNRGSAKLYFEHVPPKITGCQVFADVTWQCYCKGELLAVSRNFFTKRKTGKLETKKQDKTSGRTESRAEVTTYNW
jgi:hypothetical protein